MDPTTPEGRRKINKVIKDDMERRKRHTSGDPCAVLAFLVIGASVIVQAYI